MARQRPQFDRLSGKRFNQPCCLQLSGARLSATLTLLIFGCSTFFRPTVRSVVSPVSFRRFLFPPLPLWLTRSALVSNVIRTPLRQQGTTGFSGLGDVLRQLLCFESNTIYETLLFEKSLRLVKISDLTFLDIARKRWNFVICFVLQYWKKEKNAR